MTAADQVVIPVQCETLAHRGVSQLLDTIGDVRRLTNRGLQVRGLVATMFDPRTKHSREVLRDLLARYELPLLGAPVRKSVRFSEAPTTGISLLGGGTDVPGAAAYRIIAHELLGLEADQDLFDEAGWDAARRAEVLGLDGAGGRGWLSRTPPRDRRPHRGSTGSARPDPSGPATARRGRQGGAVLHRPVRGAVVADPGAAAAAATSRPGSRWAASRGS